MFAGVCLNYGYTLDYCLDHLTMDDVQNLYLEALRWKGVDIEKYREEPDREAIEKHYGDKIVRPKG